MLKGFEDRNFESKTPPKTQPKTPPNYAAGHFQYPVFNIPFKLG
jgi:hypothetical protein